MGFGGAPLERGGKGDSVLLVGGQCLVKCLEERLLAAFPEGAFQSRDHGAHGLLGVLGIEFGSRRVERLEGEKIALVFGTIE